MTSRSCLAFCATALLALAARAPTVPPPAPERLAALADSLGEKLAGRSVAAPDGSSVVLTDLLPKERLRTCMETISEAEAWPAAWLVVQDQGRNFDLVLSIQLDAAGALEAPRVAFATARREWDADALAAAVRTATGSKLPRERERNVVVQSFSSRTVTTYRYNTPADPAKAGGLLALLPLGSILREAHAVDLGDRQRHTLALVLQDATFVPSDCTSCAARTFGHADSGRILVILAGERALEDTLDLSAELKGTAGSPLLPRYRCAPGDEAVTAADTAVQERFAGRELVPLLELQDLDGDGRKLEFSLPAQFESCERTTRLVVRLEAATRKLQVR